MVEAARQYHSSPLSPCHQSDKWSFHFDNCGGQKNPLVAMVRVYGAILNYLSVMIRFLIPGHTNNRCHGAFGLVKNRLKTRGVNFPSEMMALLDDSTRSSSRFNGCSMDRLEVRPKRALCGAGIAKNTVLFHFPTRSQIPGFIYVMQHLMNDEWLLFNSFKHGVSASNVIQHKTANMLFTKFKLPISPFSCVKVTAKKTHEQYLVDQICQRYHNGDEHYKKTGFSTGSHWNKIM